MNILNLNTMFFIIIISFWLITITYRSTIIFIYYAIKKYYDTYSLDNKHLYTNNNLHTVIKYTDNNGRRPSASRNDFFFNVPSASKIRYHPSAFQEKKVIFFT